MGAEAEANERKYRTTCSRAQDDELKPKWARPYTVAPLYSFHDPAQEAEAQKTKAQALAQNKCKFTAHANFKLTRHPTGGVERLGDESALEEPEIGTADMWVDPEDP